MLDIQAMALLIMIVSILNTVNITALVNSVNLSNEIIIYNL